VKPSTKPPEAGEPVPERSAAPVEKEPAADPALPPALLQKLKLLPLRERELSTLRQLHQHQVRWIEGAQQLMVALTSASSIPDAQYALLDALVQEFGFDISGASTPKTLLAGDPVADLTEADRSFFEAVVSEVTRGRALVVSEGSEIAGERTLGWLMGGLLGAADGGDDLVVVVGRTQRTAAYYPPPKQQEVGLYRHLLSTVAQVFRSISLQARHNAELERKVVERTGELREAQRRVVRLERQRMAEQMAGGFAHEMRNALSGAKILIEDVMGASGDGGKSVIDCTAGELTQLFHLVREELDADALAKFRSGLAQIARHERTLDDVLRGVDGCLRRALSITTLIMEYARIGYSKRGAAKVNLGTLARAVVAERAEAVAKHSIVTSICAADDCVVVGNETHLHSIVSNLVGNAIDALAETTDGRVRNLAIEATRSGEHAVLKVADNANGIPAEIRARIFEPFFTTKPQVGTGLGLGMVQKLVALHDGTLDVDTEVGRGTTFAVSFPPIADDTRPSGSTWAASATIERESDVIK